MKPSRLVYAAMCCALVLLAACKSTPTADPCQAGGDPAQCVPAPSCTAPQLDCKNGGVDGCETNVGSDLEHCGACGSKCPGVTNGSPACAEGSCVVAGCDAPYLNCNRSLGDGCEANSSRDAEHCGDCGTRCPAAVNASPACSAGKCKFSCNAPFLDCNGTADDGCEINTAFDINNCGSCGNRCPSGPNGSPACANGTCILTRCTAPYLTCAAGPADSCETNTANDVNNCAACGNKCGQVANGTPACLNGACGIGSCNGAYKDCNNAPTDGCEVDSATDVLHCGGCGQRCDLPNASAKCTASSCAIDTCVGAYKDCDNAAPNGCEVNSGSDVNNCGACNNKCPAVMNGTPGCSAGFCGIGSCTAPYLNCNSLVSDGCETNSANDVNNCGACGNVCPVPANAQAASCAVGACAFTCKPGFADCDGNAMNGCEVNLTADVNNCSTCGNQCGLKPNTTSSACASSMCTYTCSSGWGNCNGTFADGCERGISSDVNNCGGCNVTCSIPQGTPACSNGTCQVASCNSPYGNCDGSPSNGCEINTSNNVNNCGSCGFACPTRPNTATRTCSGGGCGFICLNGWGNCDGRADTGCETNLTNDDNNCGSCGRGCGFFDWCVNSKCCTFGVFC